MRILALDLGTQTGWAWAESAQLFSGTEDFSPKRGDSTGMRYILFSRWLKEIGLPLVKGDLIAYERAHHRGGAATEVAHGFSTRVQEYAATREVDTMAVHTATIKKHATGSGRASKGDMLEVAFSNWPEQFDEKDKKLLVKAVPVDVLFKDGHPLYDQADALCLMNYILSVV